WGRWLARRWRCGYRASTPPTWCGRRWSGRGGGARGGGWRGGRAGRVGASNAPRGGWKTFSPNPAAWGAWGCVGGVRVPGGGGGGAVLRGAEGGGRLWALRGSQLHSDAAAPDFVLRGRTVRDTADGGRAKKGVAATIKQVLRGLRAVCAFWLKRQRGVGGLRAEAQTIQYHQKRNAAAARSHKKRFSLPTFWIVPLSRMDLSHLALQT